MESHTVPTMRLVHDQHGDKDVTSKSPQKPLPAVPVTLRSLSDEDLSTSESKKEKKKKGFSARWTATTKRWWIYEVVCTITSIASFAAICGVLIVADNKSQARYIYSELTLNGLIALLTTLMRASMMVAVGAALGQQRWNWFARQTRELRDLEVLDEASRGPWGSTKLLFSGMRL